MSQSNSKTKKKRSSSAIKQLSFSFFKLDFKEGVATAWLQNSKKRHAMTKAFWDELPLLVETLSKCDCRVLLFKSDGPVFSSGIDLSFLGDISLDRSKKNKQDGARKRASIYETVLYLQKAITCLENAPFVSIAAIQGPCIGGGVDFVTGCDLRYVTISANFKIHETAIGLMADVGTLQRLPKQIPEAILKEMAFTSRELVANEAMQFGFVNGMYKDTKALYKGVDAVAKSIALHSPMVLWGTKKAIHFQRHSRVEDGLDRAALWNSALMSKQDVSRSLESYLTKKQAKYDPISLED